MILNKKVFLDCLYIVVGTFFLALSINVFLLPLKLSSGGVGAIGTILLYIFDIPLSITNVALNLILFMLGYKFLDRSTIAKTLFGIVMLSAFLEITQNIYVYKEDVLIASLVGGFLMGLGIGVTIKADGSTGGSDFAGVILNKFIPHVSVPTFIFIIDTCIIIFTGVVFRSTMVTFYSIIILLVTAKVSDFVLCMGNSAKEIHIISANSSKIADCIINEFQRGVTGVYCRGMYLSKESLMLFCVVIPRELPGIINRINAIDPAAFVVINDTKEVLGQGFKNGRNIKQ